MSKLRPDEYMAIMVDVGTITEAHMLGRMREAKPVVEFGRRWRVSAHRERDGKRLFELRSVDDLFDEHGDHRPLMCSSCGSFKVGARSCEDCGGTKLLP